MRRQALTLARNLIRLIRVNPRCLPAWFGRESCFQIQGHSDHKSPPALAIAEAAFSNSGLPNSINSQYIFRD
jgi:hypothetical protein